MRKNGKCFPSLDYKGVQMLSSISTAGYVLHPALLDACIRVVAFKEFLQDWETALWFPDHIGRFSLHSSPDSSSSLFSYARLKCWTPGKSYVRPCRAPLTS